MHLVGSLLTKCCKLSNLSAVLPANEVIILRDPPRTCLYLSVDQHAKPLLEKRDFWANIFLNMVFQSQKTAIIRLQTWYKIHQKMSLVFGKVIHYVFVVVKERKHFFLFIWRWPFIMDEILRKHKIISRIYTSMPPKLSAFVAYRIEGKVRKGFVYIIRQVSNGSWNCHYCQMMESFIDFINISLIHYIY